MISKKKNIYMQVSGFYAFWHVDNFKEIFVEMLMISKKKNIYM